MSHGGYAETVEALLNHPAYKAPLGPNQGRGVASGYWFNGGGESSAKVLVNHGVFFFTWRCATRCFATRGEVSADGTM